MTNIDPKLWGKPMWDALFYIAIGYSDNPNTDDKNNMKNFFTAIGYVLPCEKCRVNYKTHTHDIKLSDSVLQSRHNLLLWLISIENAVSHLNGKKGITYQQVIDKYLMKPKCYNIFKIDSKSMVNISIILLIILLVVYIKISKNNNSY